MIYKTSITVSSPHPRVPLISRTQWLMNEVAIVLNIPATKFTPQIIEMLKHGCQTFRISILNPDTQHFIVPDSTYHSKGAING